MTKASVVFLSESIQRLHDSLKVNSVDSCHTKQRAVLEGVRGVGVVRRIPKAAAADLHALPGELADVDQDNSLISGNQKVLHAGSYHLGGANPENETNRIERVFKRCCVNELFRFIYLTYCFCHFLRPLYFIFLLLEVTGEYILQYVCDSRSREAFGRSCRPKNKTIAW